MTRHPLTSEQSFGLLDLAPEIWSTIGKLAVDDHPRPHELFHPYRGRGAPHQPPITRVCRILRGELLPYFYRTWGSHMIHWGNAGSTGRWLRAIGVENRRHVRGAFFLASSAHEAVHGKKDLQRRLKRTWAFDLRVQANDSASRDSSDRVIYYDIAFIGWPWQWQDPCGVDGRLE
ncbi:hypothetical protein CLAFUW4_05338 [Fulvia fulva]|uniref:Uncharacterized protein n=1 Tax=Passalora fulva TaxID=5499 RepID=A0A9Q8LIL5_PASFU|nr:hypothetical protein CLAFUR4_05332 [Fulvia fulva]KAK4625982.1 hypothetical protein CLAFUR0_05340 [Fulvia fulva]WPV15397.1 hypothetical protein CLAFUW4_05338 [Fulvia fulva]